MILSCIIKTFTPITSAMAPIGLLSSNIKCQQQAQKWKKVLIFAGMKNKEFLSFEPFVRFSKLLQIRM
jgi:hypothetical protein